MRSYLSITLTNAAEGRDDEYNEWYIKRHVNDVLAVPGVKSAQRFRLTAGSPGTLPFKYMTVYEIEAVDIKEVYAEIAARAGTELMPRSEAMGSERLTLEYEPITEKVTR